MKILHTADWHTQGKGIEESRSVLGHLVEQAAIICPDLIVVAGDLTHRSDIRMESESAMLTVETVSQLSIIAPVAIVAGTKFHDGNIPAIIEYVKQTNPVFVATGPEQIALTGVNTFEPVAYDGMTKAILSFLPPPTKKFLNADSGIVSSDHELSEALNPIFVWMGNTAGEFEKPHIVIGHWTVRGAAISETQQMIGRDVEITVDQILSAKPTVACLGHIHYAQQIRNHPIFYSGSVYRVDFGEPEEKGFYVHTCEGNQLVKSEFHKLPARQLHRYRIDFTDEKNEISDLDKLLFGDFNKDRILEANVRVDLIVWQDERHAIDKENIENIFLTAGADAVAVHVKVIPRANVRASSILKVERLREKVQARADMIGDTISDSILEKCDMVEDENPESLIQSIKEELGRETV